MDHACLNQILRIPNGFDLDYFDPYESSYSEEIQSKLLVRLYRLIYFLSGPKFLVPFLGKCSNINLNLISIWETLILTNDLTSHFDVLILLANSFLEHKQAV